MTLAQRMSCSDSRIFFCLKHAIIFMTIKHKIPDKIIDSGKQCKRFFLQRKNLPYYKISADLNSSHIIRTLRLVQEIMILFNYNNYKNVA